MNNPIPQAHAQLQGTATGSRSWGTFSCLGNAYGKTIANFSAPGGQPITVVIPSNLENWVLQALLNKLTVLASFDGPLGAYVNMTEVIIYN
ncbi:MAG: hypothetical protein WAZ48_00245 [Lysobacteraceae bacterium]